MSHGRGSDVKEPWAGQCCQPLALSRFCDFSVQPKLPFCSSWFLHLPVKPLVSPFPNHFCSSHLHRVPGWMWEKLFRPFIPRGAARGMGSGKPRRAESRVRGCHGDRECVAHLMLDQQGSLGRGGDCTLGEHNQSSNTEAVYMTPCHLY